MTNEPYRECSRNQHCSVNNCPLSPRYPDHYTDPEDYKTKCTIAKSIRVRIGSQHLDVLKFGGLTKREFSGRKVWEGLTESQKAKTIARGKKTFKALRLHKQNENNMAMYRGVVDEQ